MATLEVIPSGYTGSTGITASSSYPISNGYTDTDSTTYARLSLSTSSTGYLYYTFDCSDIPSTATISSITAKAKVRVSSTSRVTSTQCQMFTGTTAKGSNVTFASTSSSNVVTLSPGSSWTRAELDDLRMKIGGTGSSSSQSKYIYFYGAEVTITYVTESRTITTTLSGSGTISPSGSTTAYDGDEFVLTITPTDISSSTVTATQDGTDITSQIVAHGNETSTSTVLGTYTLISGGFNSGESWFEGIVGQGYDTSSTTTSNYYSSGSGTQAVFQYAVPFSIPSTATVTNLYMMANGHAESTSNDNEYMCVQLKSGSTAFTEQYNFKSAGTSNNTQTITATTLPTPTQLESLVVECTLGYYGGAINGVTVFLEYETGSGTTHYTYTYTVSGNSTIAVVITSSGGTDTLYVRLNGSWVEVTKAYKKVNGAWVEQSDITSLFNTTDNFTKGD